MQNVNKKHLISQNNNINSRQLKEMQSRIKQSNLTQRVDHKTSKKKEIILIDGETMLQEGSQSDDEKRQFSGEEDHQPRFRMNKTPSQDMFY